MFNGNWAELKILTSIATTTATATNRSSIQSSSASRGEHKITIFFQASRSATNPLCSVGSIGNGSAATASTSTGSSARAGKAKARSLTSLAAGRGSTIWRPRWRPRTAGRGTSGSTGSSAGSKSWGVPAKKRWRHRGTSFWAGPISSWSPSGWTSSCSFSTGAESCKCIKY